MKILWESAAKDPEWDNRPYTVNYAVIEFLSHNLRNKIGKSCTFNFAFIKAFMEARSDYFSKRVKDAIMGIENVGD